MDIKPRLAPNSAGRAVGLDIGSTAVRAVELGGSASRPALARLGQVALQPGDIVDGEVERPEAVAEALRRLWSEVGFSSRKVVIAVNGRRTIVREADVPAMSVDDFRSAMSFEVQDLIPIPMSSAVLDFVILGPAEPGPDGRKRMKILLAAAERETVDNLLEVLRLANLTPVALDVPPAATIRALGGATGASGTAVITLGGQATNVTVPTVAGGVLSRTLGVGTDRLTHGISQVLGVSLAQAEAFKRSAGEPGEAAAGTATLLQREALPLVQEVVASIAYFRGGGVAPLTQMIVTGGGTLTVGLVEALQESAALPSALADPFYRLADRSASSRAIVDRMRPFALTATGLALWTTAPAEERLSLLPAELLQQRHQRQAVLASGVAVGVLAASLGGLWYSKQHQTDSLRHQAAATAAASVALQASSRELASLSSYFGAVQVRRSELTASASAIDWPKLMDQLTAAMPANFVLTQESFASSAGGGSTSGTAGSGTAASGIQSSGTQTAGSQASAAQVPQATVTMSVQAKGGVEQVAAWLRAMSAVPALDHVWVAASTSSGTLTTFTSSATIGSKAPTLTYAWEAGK